MESHIVLEVRFSSGVEASEYIKALFKAFQTKDMHQFIERHQSTNLQTDLINSINNLFEEYGGIVAGLEYVDIEKEKLKAGFIGGWDSEEFAAALARVIYLLGNKNFEIVITADEMISVTAVHNMLIAQEDYGSLDDYYELGFQNPTYLDL